MDVFQNFMSGYFVYKNKKEEEFQDLETQMRGCAKLGNPSLLFKFPI